MVPILIELSRSPLASDDDTFFSEVPSLMDANKLPRSGVDVGGGGGGGKSDEESPGSGGGGGGGGAPPTGAIGGGGGGKSIGGAGGAGGAATGGASGGGGGSGISGEDVGSDGFFRPCFSVGVVGGVNAFFDFPCDPFDLACGGGGAGGEKLGGGGLFDFFVFCFALGSLLLESSV